MAATLRMLSIIIATGLQTNLHQQAVVMHSHMFCIASNKVFESQTSGFGKVGVAY